MYQLALVAAVFGSIAFSDVQAASVTPPHAVQRTVKLAQQELPAQPERVNSDSVEPAKPAPHEPVSPASVAPTKPADPVYVEPGQPIPEKQGKTAPTVQAPITIQVQGVPGADVSEYEEVADWPKFAAQNHFVFIRASHGLHHDETYLANWKNANGVGIVRGAYHYIDPTEPFAPQLKYFVQTVKLEPGDFYPVVDLEKPALWAHVKQADRMKYVMKWLNALEKVYGVKPIVYLSPSFVDEVLGGPVAADALKNYPLWVARYKSAVPQPIPLPWTNYIVWQYSEKGTCAGVAGYCDLDVAPGSLNDLLPFTVRQAAGGDETVLSASDLDDEGISVKLTVAAAKKKSDSQHGRQKHYRAKRHGHVKVVNPGHRKHGKSGGTRGGHRGHGRR